MLSVDDTNIDTSDSFWYCHTPQCGMDSFRNISKFADLDAKFNLTQPVSLVQFDFVTQFIVPNFNFPWRSKKEIDAVENMLFRKSKQALENKTK